MIHFNRFRLSNGLKVIVHEDATTPLAVINVLYDVGARDEKPNQTGFAHLFEHLMFGGSINIPFYDEPLQRAGGNNNAFTTNDMTDYYIQLPAQNIETAFWLESDRMLSLAFSEKSLDVQQKVVSEEFKENYINKPYGDAGKLLREMTFKKHPYRWMTIGKELSHIEDAKLEDVKEFFARHYNPSNAILVVGGNVKTEDVKEQVEKWFGFIPRGKRYKRQLEKEPEQTEARHEEVTADVPLDAFYRNYPIYDRLDKRYYVVDVITDILSGGRSSRLYQSLVKEQKLFSQINCYHYGSLDKGMLTIEGKITKGIKMREAERAVDDELKKLMEKEIAERELEKVKNRIESLIAFEDSELLSRCNSLAFYELLGDASMINEENKNYEAVSPKDILNVSREIFNPHHRNTLYYFSKKGA